MLFFPRTVDDFPELLFECHAVLVNYFVEPLIFEGDFLSSCLQYLAVDFGCAKIVFDLLQLPFVLEVEALDVLLALLLELFVLSAERLLLLLMEAQLIVQLGLQGSDAPTVGLL